MSDKRNILLQAQAFEKTFATLALSSPTHRIDAEAATVFNELVHRAAELYGSNRGLEAILELDNSQRLSTAAIISAQFASLISGLADDDGENG